MRTDKKYYCPNCKTIVDNPEYSIFVTLWCIIITFLGIVPSILFRLFLFSLAILFYICGNPKDAKSFLNTSLTIDGADTLNGDMYGLSSLSIVLLSILLFLTECAYSILDKIFDLSYSFSWYNFILIVIGIVITYIHDYIDKKARPRCHKCGFKHIYIEESNKQKPTE